MCGARGSQCRVGGTWHKEGEAFGGGVGNLIRRERASLWLQRQSSTGHEAGCMWSGSRMVAIKEGQDRGGGCRNRESSRVWKRKRSLPFTL